MKKAYKISVVFALAVALLACLALACAYNGENDIREHSVTLSAIQFGDIPETALVAKPRDLKNALLANGDAVLPETAESSAYDTVVSGLLAEKSKISLSGMGLTRDEVQSLMTEALNSTPALFYVEGRYSIGTLDGGATVEYIVPTYKATGDALADMRAEYEDLVAEILDGVRPAWSSFEKVLFIHDYLVKNFEYDYSYSIYDSYNMLKNKKGVCQSYTLLCIELLGRLDIGVGVVPSESMGHIWNCVELDGKWYHMDITWSDASADGNHDRFDEIGYKNFLCSDSAIAATGHSDWESDLTFSDDYDSLFIKTEERSRVSALGDDWYVLVKGEENSLHGISVCLADFDNNSYTKKAFIKAYWYVWGNTDSYYTDIFAGFGSYHDALVISTADTLYAYDPSVGTVELGKYTYTDGYIYGMRINSSVATLRVVSNPSDYANDTFAMVDLSEITFDLEISYENRDGETLAPKYTAEVGWGKDFSAVSPSVSGYTAENATVSGKMPLGGMSETVIYKMFGTLRIDYVYENGEIAAESYLDDDVEVGTAYSVTSPTVSGYCPSVVNVSGNMTEGGVTVTVTYRKAFCDLKIYYVYSDGRTAAETFEASGLEYMAEYSVISPSLVGYEPSIETVSGNISENTEITVTYTLIKCAVKVSYLYPDGSVIEEKEISLDWGSDYEIISPSVKGHTPEMTSVTGKAEQKNSEFTVSYIAKKYTLTIKYIYSDLTEAAKTYTVELDYGTDYSIASPDIEHYVPSQAQVSGTVSDSDIETDVVYALAKYKVDFLADGEIFFSDLLEYGSTITLPEGIPQKDPSTEKVYTFKCWENFEEGMKVSENIVFNAVFDESARKYSVVFKNHDGSVLYETEVEYGKTAVYVGETPEHLPVEGTKYTFVGWDEDIENIIKDSVFTAMFSDGVTQYTVSFYDADGTLLKSEKVYYGYSATPPSDPIKASDPVYSYTFSGWSGKYKRVTSDSTVTAMYTSAYIEYVIIFKDHDGNVISEQKLHFGDKVILPEAPTKPSDEKYDYIFTAWSPDVADSVAENAEYTAVFEAVLRFGFTSEDFITALEKVRASKTLSDRFETISEAVVVRNDMYLGDPEIEDELSELEHEIEKYNSEIADINKGFDEANGDLVSVTLTDVTCLNALVIVWELLKKLLGIN